MTELYAVEGGYNYDTNEVSGVFSTKRKAVNAAKKLASVHRWDWGRVMKLILDKPSDYNDLVWSLKDGYVRSSV